MAKRWRCYNPTCNRTGHPADAPEFVADGPECPSCHLGPPLVIPLVDVHWLASGGGRIQTIAGPHRIACQPERANFKGLHITHQPDAVTCPTCKTAAGEEFAHALAAFREENGL